jgi:hypothetical protein
MERRQAASDRSVEGRVIQGLLEPVQQRIGNLPLLLLMLQRRSRPRVPTGDHEYQEYTSTEEHDEHRQERHRHCLYRPAELALIVRANVEIHDVPIEKERVDFTGSLEQIADDIKATEKLGAAEMVLDAQFSPGVETGDDVIARMEDLWRVAHQA